MVYQPALRELEKENEMSDYSIPQEFQDELRGSMSDNTSIKLPFPAPTLYWYNGKTAFKNIPEIKDPRRFGGWGVSKEDIEEQGLPPAESWKLHDDLTNAKGKTFVAYLFRSAWVAPIARRFAWFENEGKSRSSLNILSYLALRNKEGKFKPYGAVILKASSYTGIALDRCFKEFASKTADLRGETLSNFFFHPIGTWGAEPIFNTNKSKHGDKESSVTDPQLYIPDGGYTDDFMKSCFIPNVDTGILEDIMQFKRQAADWIADWDKKKEIKNNNEEPPMPEEPQEDIPY